MSDDECAVVHHNDPQRIRLAIPGLRLCRGCYGHLTRALHGEAAILDAPGALSLPQLYDLLLIAHARGGGEKVRGGATLAERSVISDPQADARERIRVTTTRWARMLAGWLGLTNVPAIGDVEANCILLDRHIDRLAADPLAGEAKRQLTGAYDSGLHVAYPDGRVTTDLLTPCPVLDRELVRCRGTLIVTRMHHEPGRTGDRLPDVVRCTDDPEHVWAPFQWRWLRRQLVAA